jgi:5-methylcytosine-specific restriction endonuclease McrA
MAEYRDRPGNQQRQRSLAKAWEKADPVRYRRQKIKNESTRRARLRGSYVETVDPGVVFHRDNGTCGICGGPVDPERVSIDHVVPLSRGGLHSYSNVQLAHLACNTRKGSKHDHADERRTE